MNPNHEILFVIADEFVQLNTLQKLNIGLKLKLIDFNSFCRTDKAIEEMVFSQAYKQNKMVNLVEEMQRAKHVPAKQS